MIHRDSEQAFGRGSALRDRVADDWLSLLSHTLGADAILAGFRWFHGGTAGTRDRDIPWGKLGRAADGH